MQEISVRLSRPVDTIPCILANTQAVIITRGWVIGENVQVRHIRHHRLRLLAIDFDISEESGVIGLGLRVF